MTTTPQSAGCCQLDQGLHAGRDSLAGAIARILAAPFERLLEWQERLRQRQQLSEMPEHMLKDLGLTRADVVRETSKPVWKL